MKMCVNSNLSSYPWAPGMQMKGRLTDSKTVLDSNELYFSLPKGPQIQSDPACYSVEKSAGT